MAAFDFPFRRAITASVFAIAIAIAPMIAAFAAADATGGMSTAACPLGQREDPDTFACTPEVGPTGGENVAGAPSETELTECGGRDQGECLEQNLYPPAPVEQPNTAVQQSP